MRLYSLQEEDGGTERKEEADSKLKQFLLILFSGYILGQRRTQCKERDRATCGSEAQLLSR